MEIKTQKMPFYQDCRASSIVLFIPIRIRIAVFAGEVTASHACTFQVNWTFTNFAFDEIGSSQFFRQHFNKNDTKIVIFGCRFLIRWRFLLPGFFGQFGSFCWWRCNCCLFWCCFFWCFFFCCGFSLFRICNCSFFFECRNVLWRCQNGTLHRLSATLLTGFWCSML